MKKRMTFSATGDSIIMRPVPKGYNGFSEISAYIQSAEARLNNLETVLSDFDCFASAYCGGTWLNATPDVLEGLASFGFNLFGFANNHTMDYSYDGLMSTLKALDKAGLAHAGSGMDLAEASAPAIINLPSGKVGMISISSTFNDAARAGEPKTGIPGRPGLNPLRYKCVYTVTKEQMKALREIAEQTHINGYTNLMKIQGFRPAEPEGTLDFGSILFKEGDIPGRKTYPERIDVDRTKYSIKKTLETADYVVILAHSHEIKANTIDRPDYFFEEFCWECIDAGACAVIGTGTHQLKAIEIYKGKPIFYSLGNFIFQSNAIAKLPADFYEKYNCPPDYTAIQALAFRSGKSKRGLHSDIVNFRSVIPFLEFDGEKLVKLSLKPIQLDFEKTSAEYGLPKPADAKACEEIFDYLDGLNREYGTKMHMEHGIINVDI